MMYSLAPTLADTAYATEWLARFERAAGSPRRAALKQRLIFDGQYLADHIPGARYLKCPGDGHWPWVSEDAEAFMDN